MIDPQPLKGKTAIVTGAGAGIGRAYARGLAEAGAAVVLADINAGPAQAAADERVSDGFDALARRVDVTDERCVNAMAQETAERFGSVDILVNNAALMAEIMTGGQLTTIPLEMWHRTLDVGWTNTEAGQSTTTPEVRAAIARSIPFPFGEPEDLVGGLAYLASAASDWGTGHTLNIDGGWIPRT